MCRFICYRGPEILLSELLYRPANSLIRQSFHAKERTEPLNGDGFGVGWYAPQISSTPCVFASVTPAWSNQNLRRLSEHVRSTCFFAHVRAASPGMRVSEANCDPFQSGRFLWMHNGIIQDFSRIKRRLRESLPDHLYHQIEGTTDSEHAFAVFLHLLGNTDRIQSARDLGRAIVQTIGSWSNGLLRQDCRAHLTTTSLSQTDRMLPRSATCQTRQWNRSHFTTRRAADTTAQRASARFANVMPAKGALSSLPSG